MASEDTVVNPANFGEPHLLDLGEYKGSGSVHTAIASMVEVVCMLAEHFDTSMFQFWFKGTPVVVKASNTAEDVLRDWNRRRDAYQRAAGISEIGRSNGVSIHAATSMSSDDPVQIELNPEEADALVVRTCAAAAMAQHSDSFETYERVELDAAPVFADPVYKDGSLRWTDTRLDALVVAKVLRAHGHSAEQLFELGDHADSDATSTPYLVITSAPLDQPS